jgi:DNA-binding Lrp family transcriptional regulator
MQNTKHMFTTPVDETDRKILDILLDNSNYSYRKVGKKALVSVATVMHRIKRLEEEIIKRYTLQLDYEKLGYDFPAAIHIRVQKGKLFEVEKHIAKHPNVHAVYDVTGNFDVLALAKFRSRRELDSFIKSIQKLEFVERTETTLILNIIKEDMVRI